MEVKAIKYIKDHPLLFIVLIGSLLRIYLIYVVPITNPDGLLYAWMGVNLVDGNGLSIAEGRSLSDVQSWRVPMFPLSLALSYTIFGKGFIASKVPALIFGLLTVLLSYALANKIFSKNIAVLSALFVSINPLLCIYSAEIMTESTYTFFLLLFLFLLYTGYPFTAGLITGVAYLTRTMGLMLFPIAILYYLIKRERDYIKFTAAFFLVALPWWVWSYMEYGNAFSAEQYTVIYQFYQDFGYYPKERLSIASYLLGYHDFTTLFLGSIKGVLKLLAVFAYVFGVIGLIPIFIGIANRIKKRFAIDFVLLGVVFLGVLATSWQMHLTKWTELRYAVPYLPILVIYLTAGIEKMRGKKALGLSLILVFSSLLIIHHHIGTVNDQLESNYNHFLDEIPRDTSLLVSHPKVAERLGFMNIHPIGDAGFKEILDLATRNKVEYVFIDCSSLHNDDQFYLIAYWYAKRIPQRLEKIDGVRYHWMLYRISP